MTPISQKSDGHGRSVAGLGPGLFAQDRPYMFPNFAISIGTQASHAKQSMLPSDHGHCHALGSTGPYSTQLLSFIPSPWHSEIVIKFLLFPDYSKDCSTIQWHSVTVSGQNDTSNFF
jgi:hypothetical protein